MRGINPHPGCYGLGPPNLAELHKKYGTVLPTEPPNVTPQQKPTSEVEKAKEKCIGRMDRLLLPDLNREAMAAFEQAVRAEAIASTEERFRELAKKLRIQVIGSPEVRRANGLMCADQIEQLLTPADRPKAEKEKE